MTRYARTSYMPTHHPLMKLQKTDKDSPKWYMVELTFKSRTANFVPLSLLRRIAASPGSDAPSDIPYIGAPGVQAIKGACDDCVLSLIVTFLVRDGLGDKRKAQRATC